jgi:lipopolysaccharide export system protein LptA
MTLLPRLTFCVAVSIAAAEAAGDVTVNKNCNEPVHVEANTVSADLNANSMTYDGNVVVRQCDIRIRAEKVKVNTTNGGKEASTVEAHGNVVANSPASGTATGDNGVYDVQNHLVDLTGPRVVLTNEKGTTLVGTHLAVNMTTGLAKVFSSGSRVKGVFKSKPATP